MLQVRKSIFETNSSSTHAITIANNADDDFKKNLPKELEFGTGEYGWEFERYNDVKNKANYLFTGILYCDLCDEYLPKIKEILSNWGVEAIFPELAKKKSEYAEKGWYYVLADGDDGYVDHGGELKDFFKAICNDETLLMNYLFSGESFVATGNDNSDERLDCETDAKNILFDYYKGN
jgi:hypothetical protein